MVDFMNNSYIDLTNKSFGMLKAIRKAKPHITSGGKYITMWECECKCGNFVFVSSQKLRSLHTTSCGCKKKHNKGARFNDLTDRKFGRLKVIKFLEPEERENKRKCWLCECKCGSIKSYDASKLLGGTTLSCGCGKSERIGNLNRKYRVSNKRLYSVYKAMMDRCFDKDNEEYKNYGGRGITVCDEWKENFDNFAEWAFKNAFDANAKRGECTIDRIDNDKGYSPDNCRWITELEQQNNRRYHRYAVYQEDRYTLSQLSRKLNIPYMFIWHRYVEKGMTIQEIIDIYNA